MSDKIKDAIDIQFDELKKTGYGLYAIDNGEMPSFRYVSSNDDEFTLSDLIQLHGFCLEIANSIESEIIKITSQSSKTKDER
jgi:hypothetical protein